MKINILRKMRYRDTFVYVFQFEYIFMYLFPFGGEIYQNHVSFVPRLLVRLSWRLGLTDKLYSQQQIEEGEKIVLSGAMKTLDELNDPKVIAERRQASKLIERERKLNNCVWQIHEGQEDKFYMCLSHKEIVPMVDGERPNHN